MNSPQRPDKTVHLLHRVFRFILFGNLYIAICAAAQCLLTYRLLNKPPSYIVIGTVFSATCFIYNFSILRFDLRGISPGTSVRRATISKNYRLMKLMTLFSAITLIPACFILKAGSLTMLFFLSCLSALYSIPAFKWKNKRVNLRSIPGTKAVLITFIWIMSTVWIPVYESGNSLSAVPALMMFTERSMFIFTICIAFDIRDIHADSKKELYTLPLLIGERSSKLFSIALLLTYSLLTLLPASSYTLGIHLPLILTAGAATCLTLFSGSKRSDYYYHFWLDGLLILQYLLVLLL